MGDDDDKSSSDSVEDIDFAALSDKAKGKLPMLAAAASAEHPAGEHASDNGEPRAAAGGVPPAADGAAGADASTHPTASTIRAREATRPWRCAGRAWGRCASACTLHFRAINRGLSLTLAASIVALVAALM